MKHHKDFDGYSKLLNFEGLVKENKGDPRIPDLIAFGKYNRGEQLFL